MFEIGDIVKMSASAGCKLRNEIRGIVTEVIGVSPDSRRVIIADDNSTYKMTNTDVSAYCMHQKYIDVPGWKTYMREVAGHASMDEQLFYLNRNHLDDCPCYFCNGNR